MYFFKIVYAFYHTVVVAECIHALCHTYQCIVVVYQEHGVLRHTEQHFTSRDVASCATQNNISLVGTWRPALHKTAFR